MPNFYLETSRYCGVLVIWRWEGSNFTFREIVNDLSNYIHTQISEGNPVILLSYEFGKSQNILKILRISNRILLNANIAKLTRILEENGIEFPEWEPYGKYNKNQLKKLNDYILLTPPYSIFKEPYKSLIATGAKVVSLSGKVLEDIYRKEIKADYYIPLSDHCDFNTLCNFVKKCNPNNIYLEHGKICEFSYFLLKTEKFTNLKSLEKNFIMDIKSNNLLII